VCVIKICGCLVIGLFNQQDRIYKIIIKAKSIAIYIVDRTLKPKSTHSLSEEALSYRPIVLWMSCSASGYVCMGKW